MLASSFLAAQTQAVNTQNRTHLGPGPVNTEPEKWNDWHSAEAEDFTWTPPGAFWCGFVKTASSGPKAGIFVAMYTPRGNFSLESFDQTAMDGFSEDGAVLQGRTTLTVSGYPADNLTFTGNAGDGLYFTGGRTPTTVSVVHVKLEKEKGARMYPFLVFYVAAPTSAFDGVESEFENYVESAHIDPLYGSLVGRVTSQASGIGISGIAVQLLDSRTSQTLTRTTQSDGTYRFDSLLGSNYYMTLAQTAGFKPQAQPTIIELTAGTDTTGIDFQLEAAEVPVVATNVKPKPQPKPAGPPSELRFGIGYRHRLNDIWGAGVNLRDGNFVPEFTLGLDVGGEGSDTAEAAEGRLFMSLGASYYFLHADNAHLGLGLYGMTQVLGSKTMLGAEVPLTVEYFIIPKLSVQASTGVVLTALADKVNFSIGPQSILGSLGFTWYLK
jgi:hypothetical protein